ncbi:MAG: ribonuclease HII [Bacteroidota bacterium]
MNEQKIIPLRKRYSTAFIEAGCDEAGRGCLAGPVVAAAVVLPEGFFHPLLNDSKLTTHKQREILRDFIMENAIAWSVGLVDNVEIDKINILEASIKAMHLALDALSLIPELLLIDGNRFKPYRDIPHYCVIGGDGIYQSIAAASILAKTQRDRIMTNLHNEYPQYNWGKNKGYPTLEHRKAVSIHGTTPYHRLTFNMSYQTRIEL